jgi:sec-independent protein translocase protein TatB
VFDNVSGWELIVVVLAGLFIIGPERLPKVISDTMRFLRSIRTMARNATNDLSRELGTTIELEDLHPKTFLRKHLLSESDEAQLRRPFQDMYADLRGTADAFDLNKEAKPVDGPTVPDRKRPRDLRKSPELSDSRPPIAYAAT